MVLKVDLKCRRCYKKVKKILCKIPREFLFLSLFSVFLCTYVNVRVFGVNDMVSKAKKKKSELLCDVEFCVQEKYKTRYTTRSRTR